MMRIVVSSLVAAVLVLALLTVVPGPDVAVVTRAALASGRSAAARATLGIVTGCLVWGALTVAGLAAILAASATAYTVVKFVGAGYLVFLGLQTLWRTRRGSAAPAAVAESGVSRGRPFRNGLWTNLLNPKIAVFYTGLLPQLVPAGAPVTPTLLALVGVHAVLGLVWLNLYAALLHGARGTLSRPRVRLVIDRVTGTVLVGFGLRVAAQHS
jgi:threonine/homoserine/homoserine lactone efflux protein